MTSWSWYRNFMQMKGNKMRNILERSRHLELSWTGLTIIIITAMLPAVIAEAGNILDISDPGNRATCLWENWGHATGDPISFAGDIDGDGIDDFLYYGNKSSHGFNIAYGSPEIRKASMLQDLRKTEFESAEAWPWHHSAAGDVDGDGYSDIMIQNAYVGWQGVYRCGLAAILFGSADLPEKIDIEKDVIDPESAGVRRILLFSRENGLKLSLRGENVASVGDLNGDGLSDIAISCWDETGSHTVNGTASGGRLYVIYGGFPTGEDIDMARVGQDIPGFVMYGAYGRTGDYVLGDCLGYSFAEVGDVNGDGFDDIAISANLASLGGYHRNGVVYIILGGTQLPGEIYAADIPPEVGFVIYGTRNLEEFGSFVSGIGDKDGDGFYDFAVGRGQPGMGGGQGRLYLIYGKKEWDSINKLSHENLRHFVLEGPSSTYANSYTSTCGIGDWNGDGYDDFLAGLPCIAATHDDNVSRIDVVYGTPDLPMQATYKDIGVNIPGLVIKGPGGYLHLGSNVSFGGDLDGDGYKDILAVCPSCSVFNQDAPAEDSCICVLWGGITSEETVALSRVHPDTGELRGGYRVSLHGRGFNGSEQVTFDGIPATDLSHISNVEIAATVPKGKKEGAVDVKILREDGEVQCDGCFRYFSNLWRTISIDEDLLMNGSAHMTIVSGDPLVDWNVAVSSGDVNGDGRTDLGMFTWTLDRTQAYMSIIFGNPDLPPLITDDTVENYGIRLECGPQLLEMPGDYFSLDVTIGDDLNGDGISDILVYAGAEKRFAVFGRAAWESQLEILSEVEAGRGFEFKSQHNFDRLFCAGDLNGDIVPDFVTNYLPPYNPDGIPTLIGDCEGFVSIYHGYPAGDPPIQPDVQIMHTGTAFGDKVCNPGDMNGDAWGDLLVSSSSWPDCSVCNRVWLLLGDSDGFAGISTVDELYALNRVVGFHSADERNKLKIIPTSPAWDFNGDGYADGIVNDKNWNLSDLKGCTYLLLGSPVLGIEGNDINIEGDNSNILIIQSESSKDFLDSVSPLGDINGDGLADIGFTVKGQDNPVARIYAVFGHQDPPDIIDLGAPLEHGFKITGITETITEIMNFKGTAGGDFNGNGCDDIALSVTVGDSDNSAGLVYSIILWDLSSQTPFVRGDANADGQRNVADAITILTYLFSGGLLECHDSADLNDDGAVNIADTVYLLSYLFAGGDLPKDPFPECGPDPTEDALPLCVYPAENCTL